MKTLIYAADGESLGYWKYNRYKGKVPAFFKWNILIGANGWGVPTLLFGVKEGTLCEHLYIT